MSEARDAEDVRELLSRYFATCRTLIARYGGTVEKFIGDAVMAVWGTPVARDGDDAERAVRAAIDLVAVDLAARREVGVDEPVGYARPGSPAPRSSPSGPAAEHVVGDRRSVNTASRIQSVGRARRRCWSATPPTGPPTRPSPTREDEGALELRGKAEPVQPGARVRVVAGWAASPARGPVSRPRSWAAIQLRALRSSSSRRSSAGGPARLVSVMGDAGIGKSPALVGAPSRHHRRAGARASSGTAAAACPTARGSPTGRSRRWSAPGADHAEGRTPPTAGPSCSGGRGSYVTDPRERRLVEPRLAQL